MRIVPFVSFDLSVDLGVRWVLIILESIPLGSWSYLFVLFRVYPDDRCVEDLHVHVPLYYVTDSRTSRSFLSLSISLRILGIWWHLLILETISLRSWSFLSFHQSLFCFLCLDDLSLHIPPQGLTDSRTSVTIPCESFVSLFFRSLGECWCLMAFDSSWIVFSRLVNIPLWSISVVRITTCSRPLSFRGSPIKDLHVRLHLFHSFCLSL